ncbi:MAG TPA: hypothetical protein VFO52_14695 [Longimicrobiales bacterium]|nr:hypothetical protein [Longimicrobiales bacterium]
MARKHKDRSKKSSSTSGMEGDRAERIRTAGTHGDARAGDEGVDDPAMSGTQRDDMSSTPPHGDRPAGEGTNEKMSARQRGESSQHEKSQRSGRTGQRANDERFDDASGFGGQGAQRENAMENAEGTGYRGRENSNSDDSN